MLENFILPSDFNFGGQFLSRAHCLQNLNKVRDLCNSNLPLPGFHLNPEEMVSLCQSDALKINIIALLSFLFACFEVKGVSKVSGEGGLGSTVNGGVVANGASQHRSGESSQDGLTRKRCLPKKDKRLPLSHLSHYSYSMDDVRTEHQLQNGGGRVPPLPKHLSHNLSSLSTSALVDHHHPVPNGNGLRTSNTVFNAPVRSSLTVPQAAALAGFNKQMRLPGGNKMIGHHQPKTELITASTENLHIREQMISERMSRAGGRKQKPVHYNASLSSSSNNSSSLELSTSGAADVSGNSTVSWHVENISSQPSPHPASVDVNPSTSSEAISQNSTPPKDLPTAPLQYSSNHPKQSVQFYVDLKTNPKQEEVKRSFTISKHHTLASANAEGLPVISNKALKDSPSEYGSAQSQPNPNQTFTSGKENGEGSEILISEAANPNETPGLATKAGGIVSSHDRRSREVSTSASSISSAPTVIVLNLFPKSSMAERNRFLEKESSSSSVPPEILELRQKLEEKEAEIRKLQAVREKQLLLERQRFGQKAYLALMERSRASQIRAEVATSHLLQTESECRSTAHATDVDHSQETPQQASQPVSESSQVLHPTLSEPTLPAITALPDLNPTGSLTNIEKAEHITTRASPWKPHCSTGKKVLPGTSQPAFAQLPLSPIQPLMRESDSEDVHLAAQNPWTTPLQQSGIKGGKNTEPPAVKMVSEHVKRHCTGRLQMRQMTLC